MSTLQAILILALLAAGLTLLVWLWWKGWSPGHLPQWAGWVWGLLALMLLVPARLPADIRWSSGMSIVQLVLGAVVLTFGLKALILLMRHGPSLSSAQRWAAYLCMIPLLIGVLAVAVFFWTAGMLGSKK